MDYVTVKWLHILSSTLLFGTGIGSAFYLLLATLGRRSRAANGWRSTCSTRRSASRTLRSSRPALGAHAREDGQLEVDDHQQTSVDALYAAGDVVCGLNQINVAAGHAAIAATAIHNRL